MREDGCDVEAAGALHVHEKRARSWDKGLKGFKLRQILEYDKKFGRTYLQLVLAGLRSGSGVEKIFSENLGTNTPAS